MASGAGLVSLSMQLIESTQKLKSFCAAFKDAPSTVAELCFELETMSLSFRQLESHRHSDVDGDELLGRCIMTCRRMVTKIEQAVNRVERVLQRSRGAGKLYMAFKDPEIEKFLEEAERAKTIMLLAYVGYCQ